MRRATKRPEELLSEPQGILGDLEQATARADARDGDEKVSHFGGDELQGDPLHRFGT